MSALSNRYAKEVACGKRTLLSCPKRYKNDIIAYLYALVESGELTQDEYDEMILK